MHARQQIREAIRSRLIGLASTADSVHVARAETLPQTALPAIVLKFGPEQAEAELVTLHGTTRPRTLAVTIEAHVMSGGIDALDQIADEIETALESDPTFGGKVKHLELDQTDLLYNADGDRDFMSLVLSYRVTYQTSRTSPSSIA